jgi:hypothetical protein
MASPPKKPADPTEAALSAIEEALQLGPEVPATRPTPPQPRPQAPLPASPASAHADDMFDRPRPARRPVRSSRRPANDDRQSVGQIIAALRRRPSRTPYLVAFVLSASWALAAIYVSYGRIQQDLAGSTRLADLFELPYFLPLLAVILLPGLGMFALAALIRRTQDMRNVARAMSEVTLRLAEPEGISTDAIVSVGHAVRRELAALGDGVERAIARATELEAMVKNEVATLERAYDDNELRVRSLVDQLQSEREALLTHADRLHEAIGSTHQTYIADVDNIADRINSRITDVADRVTAEIAARAEAARMQLAAAGDSVAENLTQKGQEATDRMTQVGVEIARALGVRGSKVAENLQESVESLAKMIGARGEAVKDLLTLRLKATEDAIAQRGSEIADRIAADTANLNRRISEGLQGLDTTVRSYGNELMEQINRSVNTLGESARVSLTGFDERISGKTREIADTLDARIARIEQTLDARTQSLNETMAGRTLEFARTISDGARSATEAVDRTVAGMGQYFAGKAQEIANTISERTEAINQTLGQRAMEITENLDTRVGRFEQMVVTRLESITNSIEAKGVAVADQLAAKVERVTEVLRNDTAQVERSLSSLAEDVSKTLVVRAGQVVAAHETMRKDVNGVLENLAEAHNRLKVVLDSVTGHLGPLESSVAERITAFQGTLESTIVTTRGAVERMDGQLRGLSEVSTGVLQNVSELTQRFEDQSRFIAAAADNIDLTHRKIDSTLVERREALEQLAGQIATRATDFEERITRFNQFMQDSFAAAETRAQEIAKLVTDSTSQTTQAIARQYELMRSTSHEERERTAASLKSTYDEAMEEVNLIFRDVQSRFGEAARELREVADEVQRSLDQTRDALKRGILELPHETRESTAAMRRVVADQIKALSELNEIVTRHGRGPELVEPRRMPYREEVTTAPEREPDIELPRPMRPMMARGEAGPRESEPPRRARGSRNGGNWLSDLLTRNNPNPREAEGGRGERGDRGDRSPLQTIESLETLSTDVARLIDHDAAVELWDRYKRGERNVFTRRLYTNQGQKSFDEIRKRYRRSPEFRETVDHYIDDFERLLDQVARDDRGQGLTRSYLTSDTGKVYTLLAHAAGRLV